MPHVGTPGRRPQSESDGGGARHRARQCAHRDAATARNEAVDRLARELIDEGEGARRITVVGTARNVGTTMTAIALARSSRRPVARRADRACRRLAQSIGDRERSLGAGHYPNWFRGRPRFGEIITRDRHSRAHLIMAGRAALEPATLMDSPRLSIAIEALAHSYDHVVIDAGVADAVPLERFAMLAPRAVLAGGLDNAATALVRSACSRQASPM